MKRIVSLIVALCMLDAVLAQNSATLTSTEIQVLLDRHNFWRADVGVNEKLVWSDELATLAHDWAIELKRNNCGFEHRPNNEAGENLFKGTSGHYSAAYVVDAWGGEKEYYNYSKNKCKRGEMCGHYTQIVWKSTKKVGCAKISCDGFDIWVCNYDPPGNWVGEKPY